MNGPTGTAKAYPGAHHYGAKWRGEFAFVDGLGTPEPGLNRRHRVPSRTGQSDRPRAAGLDEDEQRRRHRVAWRLLRKGC